MSLKAGFTKSMLLTKFYIRFLTAFILIACNSNPKEELPSTINAKVIAIKDGDTIEILYEGKPVKVRLAHIDCPEIRNSQPFGKAAKQLASDLCYGQEVQVLNDGQIDRYGRLIAVIINANNQNVNKEMLRAGMAWHYKKFSNNNSYANLELEARENKRGLWKEGDAVPPWEWRGVKKREATEKVEKADVLAQ